MCCLSMLDSFETFEIGEDPGNNNRTLLNRVRVIVNITGEGIDIRVRVRVSP